jgi:opacity protein-like surface antigen
MRAWAYPAQYQPKAVRWIDTDTGAEPASASAPRWGGVVGFGFEYGFAPNWSVGLEYHHLFMGDANNSFSVVNPIVAGALNRIRQDVDMVTLRITTASVVTLRRSPRATD